MKAPNAAALGTPQIHNEYFFHNEPHNDAPSVSVRVGLRVVWCVLNIISMYS